MVNKLHPNTRSAWMLVALTVMMSAGVVGLFHFATSTTDGNILFTQYDGNDYEIFMMDAHGNIEQLTDNDVDDWGAGWSPDFRQIAFRSERDGLARIFVMNADGSQARAVSPESLYGGEWGQSGIPSWSPNGDSLAYEAVDLRRQNASYDIFVTNINDDTTERITNHPANELHPDFSPNGEQIAFARDGVNNDCYNECDIFVMNIDGSDVEQYTYANGMDVFPQWSPDGSQILFHSERTGNSEIYVMNADGSNPSNLTKSPALDRVARWSADGNSIIFRSERDGDSDIYVMNLNTRETELKLDNTLYDLYPDW